MFFQMPGSMRYLIDLIKFTVLHVRLIVQDSKNVLVPKCSPVEYNQSFFEIFKYNTA